MKKYLLLLSLVAITNCASITTGQNQSVSVNTAPHTGANCTLTNDKGKWHIPVTPGSVVVQRSFSDLNVSCTKNHLAGMNTVKSKTKAMAFGNVLFGGVIGAAVDTGTGSAFDYPTSIDVILDSQSSS